MITISHRQKSNGYHNKQYRKNWNNISTSSLQSLTPVTAFILIFILRYQSFLCHDCLYQNDGGAGVVAFQIKQKQQQKYYHDTGFDTLNKMITRRTQQVGTKLSSEMSQRNYGHHHLCFVTKNTLLLSNECEFSSSHRKLRKLRNMQLFASSLTTTSSRTFTQTLWNCNNTKHEVTMKIKHIHESIWRKDAIEHQQIIFNQLKDGLIVVDNNVTTSTTAEMIIKSKNTSPSSSSLHQDQDQQNQNDHHQQQHNNHFIISSSSLSLDPKNPIYNFLIEYYGIKGSKGIRKLLRWSPSIYEYYYDNIHPLDYFDTKRTMNDTIPFNRNIENSKSSDVVDSFDYDISYYREYNNSNDVIQNKYDGILLEGAKENDLIDLLHIKGVTSINRDGIIYNPSLFYQQMKQYNKEDNNSMNQKTNNIADDNDDGMLRMISSLLWSRSILEATVNNEPILHCYGLHEWAMQYYPYNAVTAPSSQKYQSHLSLRVTRDMINHVVEDNGIHCTHMDALRFFAPEANQYNQYGNINTLQRSIDQIRLEQPGCIHAQMDLLKYCLKIQPYYDCQLLQQILECAIRSRKLDIRASPYDVQTLYGLSPIHVETTDGKKQYRDEQIKCMKQTQPLRIQLLNIYDLFIRMTFPLDKIIHVTRKRKQQQ